MELRVTSDVAEEIVGELIETCRDVVELKRCPAPSFRSVEGPSFIQIMAKASEWSTVLKVAAVVFLSQIAKEAATDLWKNKMRIAETLKAVSVKPLRTIAESLASARRKAPRKPDITLGLPIPDRYFGTAITFSPSDVEEVAWVLACFVDKVDKIEGLVRSETEAGRGSLGRFILDFERDGTFVVRWVDRDQMKKHEQKID